MGSVAQAVVEFDEAVQAPWRPPLAQVGTGRAQLRVVTGPVRPRPVLEPGTRPGFHGPSHHEPRRPSVQPRRPVPAGPALRRSGAGPRARARGEYGVAAGAGPGVRGAATPGVRLTRRARRLGAVLGLAIGVAVGSWLGSVLAGEESGLRLAGESSVVVHQGDTLWSIAAGVAGPEDDIRAVVAEIRELNGLPGASLVPGQVLVLP